MVIREMFRSYVPRVDEVGFGVRVVDGIEVDESGKIVLKRKTVKMFNGNMVKPPRACHHELPVHAKPVPVVDLARLSARMCKQESRVWQDLKRFIDDEAMYEGFCSTGRKRRTPLALLSDDDVTRLVTCGIARPISGIE